MKFYKVILLLALLGIFGCKKESSKPPINSATDNFKIEIIKGNNQTDSIGHMLKDSIIIRVTNNGKLVNNAYLRFTGSGCEENITTEVLVDAGLGLFKWQLSGVVGSQQLKVILLDSARAVRDSMTIKANAAMPLHGWQPSPCMVPYANRGIKSFCRLKTGKIFAWSFNSNFLLSSDDNGINWNKLPEIDGRYPISTVVAGPDDGLFMLTNGNGILYSPDAGKTWTPRNNGIANFMLTDALYTSTSGKVYAVVHSDGKTYSTNDNGQNWGNAIGGIYEHPSGKIYALDNMHTLRSSSNGGQSWDFVFAFPITGSVDLIFIDDKGYIYITMSNNYNDMRTLRSADNGLSFTPVYTATYVQGIPLAISQFSEYNGAFYFYVEGSGLIKTTDFKTYNRISFTFAAQSHCYILAKNNQPVIGMKYGSIYYYLP